MRTKYVTFRRLSSTTCNPRRLKRQGNAIIRANVCREIMYNFTVEARETCAKAGDTRLSAAEFQSSENESHIKSINTSSAWISRWRRIRRRSNRRCLAIIFPGPDLAHTRESRARALSDATRRKGCRQFVGINQALIKTSGPPPELLLSLAPPRDIGEEIKQRCRRA